MLYSPGDGRGTSTSSVRSFGAEREPTVYTLSDFLHQTFTFNIGGKMYCTAGQTIFKEPKSLLVQAAMSPLTSEDIASVVESRNFSNIEVTPACFIGQSKKEIFFDRNPKTFKIILNYLRSSKADLDNLTPLERRELTFDVIYYRIESMYLIVNVNPLIWNLESSSKTLLVSDNQRTIGVLPSNKDASYALGSKSVTTCTFIINCLGPKRKILVGMSTLDRQSLFVFDLELGKIQTKDSITACEVREADKIRVDHDIKSGWVVFYINDIDIQMRFDVKKKCSKTLSDTAALELFPYASLKEPTASVTLEY